MPARGTGALGSIPPRPLSAPGPVSAGPVGRPLIGVGGTVILYGGRPVSFQNQPLIARVFHLKHCQLIRTLIWAFPESKLCGCRTGTSLVATGILLPGTPPTSSPDRCRCLRPWLAHYRRTFPDREAWEPGGTAKPWSGTRSLRSLPSGSETEGKKQRLVRHSVLTGRCAFRPISGPIGWGISPARYKDKLSLRRNRNVRLAHRLSHRNVADPATMPHPVFYSLKPSTTSIPRYASYIIPQHMGIMYFTNHTFQLYFWAMAIDHTARARRAWPILVRRVLSGARPFTYGELCDRLGLHPRAAQYFLGKIQQYCRRKGWPRLQAFAVQGKKPWVPGAGYEGSRTPAGHAAEIARVRKYGRRWPKKAPF